MSLTGSTTFDGFYVDHSGSPGIGEFKSYQYTLLTRGEDIRRQPGITIQDVLNNTPNTCSFTVDGGAPTPKVGEKIEILDTHDSNRRLFAGTVQSIDQIYEGQTTQVAWRVQCIDFTWLFNKKRPFGQWKNQSVSKVVQDLVARFAPGFTTVDYVQTNLAKVTVTLDGSKDMVTVFNELASAIGGGHWYIDYDQKVHFFHVVPPGLEVPIGPPPFNFDHITLAQSGNQAAGFTPGYYILRHTFIYSDGSESQYRCISSPVYMDGAHQFSITTLPTGANIGSTITCVGRRIYYNLFMTGYPGGEAIEKIHGFCQVNDNTTTAFTCNFGGSNASVATVIAGTAVFAQTYTAYGALTPNPATAGYVRLSDQAADKNLTGAISNGFYVDDPGIPAGGYTLVSGHKFATRGWIGFTGAGAIIGEGAWPIPRNSGDVYFASPDVAAALEAQVTNNQTGGTPVLTNTGHFPGPTAAPVASVDTIYGSGYWNGGPFQFKVACLYRDGSVSFPSPASNTALQRLIKGQGIKGFNLTQIPLGVAVESNDCVARFIYYSMGVLSDPNRSISGFLPDGFEWPVPFNDPTWSPQWTGGIIVIPDNTTTSLSQFSLADYGNSGPGTYTGLLLGRGNLPYNSGGANGPLSTDPIPIWPNPDGPYLEDLDPPADIDDTNEDLLHEDSGSQPFTMSTDLSQVRNRIMVIGAGSSLTATANAGDQAIYVGDISAFSPAGGTVKYSDPGTGAIVQLRYTGVQGVPGNAAITLSSPLTQAIAQGTDISNFFLAEDIESQKFLAKIELDKDGRVTDGIHEYTIVDTSMKAVFQLFMRAYAELELFSKPIVTIRYATRDPKSRSGQTVHVDMTTPPCTGDFLIQSVTIDQIHDESDQLMPRYTVTASSSKFDLNDLLLKIIGGSINSGGSSNAGIVAAGVSQAATTSSGNGLPNPAYCVSGGVGKPRRWTSYGYTHAGQQFTLGHGIATGANSLGSSTNINDDTAIGGAIGNWVKYLPVNNNGNLCGIMSTPLTGSMRSFWNFRPKAVMRFRTGSRLHNVSIASGNRTYWFGLFVTDPANGGVPIVTDPHVALLCHNPSNSQGSFEISSTVSGTGTTQVRTNAGFAPMLPLTHYRVTITTALTSASILVEDLTRSLSYTAGVNISAYDRATIPTKDWHIVMFGSATIMAGEDVVGEGGLEIGGYYMEAD